jgi:hypothetical protein
VTAVLPHLGRFGFQSTGQRRLQQLLFKALFVLSNLVLWGGVYLST